ncbi:MAG TPA: hypothetical protein VN763_15965, partial [Saprospiraceae bacterium]|nr:hypothetical protein [Saprospiraceae bacterium]
VAINKTIVYWLIPKYALLLSHPHTLSPSHIDEYMAFIDQVTRLGRKTRGHTPDRWRQAYFFCKFGE